MIVLDLFSGAGGSAMGYHRAGFKVVGVDNVPQPDYPFTFVLADVMQQEPEWWARFDLVHASPPCQPYSKAVTSASSPWNDTLGKDEPALIPQLRDMLKASGVPYVIENVPSAPLDGITLCGSMFNLDIPRHRIFESSLEIVPKDHPKHVGMAKRAAERRGWDYRDMTVTGKGRRAGTSERWSELLGIDWHVTQHQLKEAIPPEYTLWIGRQAMALLS